jgi:flagellar hook assembly protein FlgD
LTYALPHQGNVQLAVVDVRGRLVKTIADGPVAAGTHDVEWAARDVRGAGLAPGVYLVRLAHAGGVDVARLIVVR